MKSKSSLIVLLCALSFGLSAFAEQNEYHALRLHNRKHFETEPLKNAEDHNRRYNKKKASDSGPSQDAEELQNSQRDPASESESNTERKDSVARKRKLSGVR